MRKLPVLGLASMLLAGVAVTRCTPPTRTLPGASAGGAGGTAATGWNTNTTTAQNTPGWNNTRQTDMTNRGGVGTTGMVDTTAGMRTGTPGMTTGTGSGTWGSTTSRPAAGPGYPGSP